MCPIEILREEQGRLNRTRNFTYVSIRPALTSKCKNIFKVKVWSWLRAIPTVWFFIFSFPSFVNIGDWWWKKIYFNRLILHLLFSFSFSQFLILSLQFLIERGEKDLPFLSRRPPAVASCVRCGETRGKPVRAVALGRSCGGRFALRAGAPAYVLHQGHPSIHATGSATPVVPVGKHTRW